MGEHTSGGSATPEHDFKKVGALHKFWRWLGYKFLEFRDEREFSFQECYGDESCRLNIASFIHEISTRGGVTLDYFARLKKASSHLDELWKVYLFLWHVE